MSYRGLVFLLLLISSSHIRAQLTAKVGDITTLSVGVSPQSDYTWDLYVHTAGINFANAPGNCPSDAAKFITSNTGESVQVQWLKPGIYFYKATATTDCSNNLKIGKVIVLQADIPPTPIINVQYDCTNGTAVLKAENYTGTLLWSTGETSPSTIVNTKATSFISPTEYTLIQTVNGVQSKKAEVKIQRAISPEAPDATVMPTTIYLGESATLTADACTNGALHWYSDSTLSDELTDLEVSPTQTTSYYAVCRTEIGCESPYTEVVLKVIAKDACTKAFEEMVIPNAISPNEDGFNDKWSIEDLRKYCLECGNNAKVSLFNRWGVKVYEKEGYMIDSERFNGYSQHFRTIDLNKKLLPSGVYFYLLEFDDGRYKTGWLYIDKPDY